MHLTTEEIENKKKVLFISRKSYSIIEQIKKKLIPYGHEYFSSPYFPSAVSHFQYIFFFDTRLPPLKDTQNASPSVFVILFNQSKKRSEIETFLKNRPDKKIKVVIVDEYQYDEEMIEKIVWFLFSKSSEKILNLERFKTKSSRAKKTFSFPKLHLHLKKTHVLLIVASVFLFIELFFILPTAIAGVLLYSSVKKIEVGDIDRAKKYVYASSPFVRLGQSTYTLSRPVFSFFYLALFPDTVLESEKIGFELIEESIAMSENGQKVVTLILDKNKTEQKQQEVKFRINQLQRQLKEIETSVASLERKLSYNLSFSTKIKEKMNSFRQPISQARFFLDSADEMLGLGDEKKYLLLFENNMELRPGGGFIGSFGVAKFVDYTLYEFRVYDVYDADGQLKIHIDPPDPIRTYLNQPNWFLRDSNFSPDFPQNVRQAEFFLEKEIGLTDFDGVLAVTTTAIQYMLKGFGPIYVTDYKDTITSDNFYIKTQTYAEKDFFPGSIQKKSFLSAFVTALFVQLQNVSYPAVFDAIKKSLDEKQIVLNFKNDLLQKNVDQYGWSGKIIVPSCAKNSSNCISNYFAAIDANMGINKANFFVSRLLTLKTKITEDGKIENFLSITFKNDSSQTIFPGGIYKNYFQVYMPKTSTLQSVVKDTTRFDDYQEVGDLDFKTIRMYFEVPPQTTTQLTIAYTLAETIKQGKNSYQLIVQKQIGSSNNDLVFELYLPSTIAVTSQNFVALAKEGSLVYNTTLSTDRIFFVELTKR